MGCSPKFEPFLVHVAPLFMMEYRQGCERIVNLLAVGNGRNLLVPVHVEVLVHEDAAVGTIRLAVVVLTIFDGDTHVGKVIAGLEGQEDAIGTSGVLARTVALFVVRRGGSLVNLSRNVMPVDFANSGGQVRHRIAVMSHSPRRRQLAIQPGREGLITDTGRAEGSELNHRRRNIKSLVGEGQISGRMGGQCSSQRVTRYTNGSASFANVQRVSDGLTSLGLNILISVPEA